MAEMPQTAAQQAADAQARQAWQSYRSHRSALQALADVRPNMCMAQGWVVTPQTFHGDYDLDDPVLQRLLQGGTHGRAGGPVLRAAPRPPMRLVPPPAGPSAFSSYLFAPPPSAPAGSAQRLMQELPGAVYGPGNVLANSSAALAGAVQGLGEVGSASLLLDGIQQVQSGRASSVRLSPSMDLYNAAKRGQRPRVRLRVRGAPVTVVQQAIPATGGAQTQWRVNGSQTTASLRTQGMSSQQLRNTAIFAAEQRLPASLRWASSLRGGGVLTFAPSAALDLYNATEVDLQTRQVNFKGQQFLVDSARSQSGNMVGFVGGIGTVALVGAVTAGAVAGAPLLLIGLAAGITLQVAWNWVGGADAAAGLTQRALN
jgi:hypothetical protein